MHFLRSGERSPSGTHQAVVRCRAAPDDPIDRQWIGRPETEMAMPSAVTLDSPIP
jgi:hypothetical protein